MVILSSTDHTQVSSTHDEWRVSECFQLGVTDDVVICDAELESCR